MQKISFFIYPMFYLLISCNSNEVSGKAENEISGVPLSAIRLVELNGDIHDMTQYNGKTVFINFWATWCKPCLKEMPSIQRAMEALKNENIVFLFASEESADEITEFSNSNTYPFQYLHIENPEELRIMGWPTTYIYNAEGKRMFAEIGYRKWDSNKNIELLKEIISKP